MLKQDLYSIIEKVATCMTTLAAKDFREYCPVSNIDIDKWEWPQGVGMYALFRYYKLCNNQEMLNWIVAWYDRHLELGLPSKNINTTAPMLTLVYLCEELGDKRYIPYIEDWAESVFNQFTRTEEAGFQHSGSGVNDLQGQLWDDTLVMTCLFLGKAGGLLGNKKYLVECERQFLLHTKYLCDHKTGLWFHGWTFEGRHNFGEALWGRGNGWISFAIADMLEFDGISESVKLFLQETLYSQVRALKKYQDESGMWRTLINDTTSYLEASGTCGMAYGILKGVRMGFIPNDYRIIGERAVRAILARIDEDGAVLDVSYGTNVGNDSDDYKQIPLRTMPYGQALTILVLSEAGYLCEDWNQT